MADARARRLLTRGGTRGAKRAPSCDRTSSTLRVAQRGSPFYRDNVPTRDALIVTRIRGAGAVTVGKTNTPEFGAGSQTFNTVFGATRNPHDLGKTCGGSSGGAAVALACGMVPIADGSDTGGSLRNPRRRQRGRVRPSPGPRAERVGIVVAAFGLGPMARSVRMWRFSEAIAGPDARSSLSILEGRRHAFVRRSS